MLHKATLRILGYDFLEGREALQSLKQNKSRRYTLKEAVTLVIYTDQGTLRVATEPSFIFDGRSGPKIVDWYVPNLGSLEERMCWYVHDCNGYGLGLDFKDTNTLLYAMLRDLAKYRPSKAGLIQLAVGVSKSWYGVPGESDWCYGNLGKVSTVWTGQKR